MPPAYDAARAVPSSAIPTAGVPASVATVTGTEKPNARRTVSPAVQPPAGAAAIATDATVGRRSATAAVAALSSVSAAPPSSVNVTRAFSVLPTSAGSGA